MEDPGVVWKVLILLSTHLGWLTTREKELPYRTKIRRTKLSKFWLGVENFVPYFNTKVRKNRTKLLKFRLDFENFVRRNIVQ